MIVDASVAARWYLEGPHTQAARALLSEPLYAPDLVIIETLNAVWKAVTFGAGKPSGLAMAAGDVPTRFVELVASPELAPRATEIAVEIHHPVYDCMYLALAERRDEQLVTGDMRFLRKGLSVKAYSGLFVSLDTIQ